MHVPVVYLRDPQTGAVFPCRVGQRVEVGRADPSSSPDVAVDDPHVSRRHCSIEALPGGGVRVVDRSSYGTFVGGRRIAGEDVARAGESIVLGYTYALEVLEVDPVAATAAMGTGEGASSAGGLAATGQDATVVERAVPALIAGRYRVLREVGRGGMGVVYEAVDEQRGARCAIKVLRAGDEQEASERFRREAHLASVLGDYPAIVKALDYGPLEGGQGQYFAMDFVDGESLGALARRGLPVPLGVKLVARTARAVDYAHVRGVVHRDLKPENVLVVEREGHAVRLTDFGIAKVHGSGLTMTGIVLGTPHYMAPEQIEDSKRAGPAADVYGLGAILYMVLTRRPPYEGKRVGEILRRVQKGELTPPRDLVPDLDPALDALCRRALAVDPAKRPPSAAAFAKGLEEWLKANHGATEQVRLQAPRPETRQPPG